VLFFRMRSNVSSSTAAFDVPLVGFQWEVPGTLQGPGLSPPGFRQALCWHSPGSFGYLINLFAWCSFGRGKVVSPKGGGTYVPHAARK
jgi:hypothetical protein